MLSVRAVRRLVRSWGTTPARPTSTPLDVLLEETATCEPGCTCDDCMSKLPIEAPPTPDCSGSTA
jgi:hypothetical protein